MEQDGEIKLQKYELLEEASRFLRSAPRLPLPRLLRDFGVEKVTSLSMYQLREMIRRGKAGTLWLGMGIRK